MIEYQLKYPRQVNLKFLHQQQFWLQFLRLIPTPVAFREVSNIKSNLQSKFFNVHKRKNKLYLEK